MGLETPSGEVTPSLAVSVPPSPTVSPPVVPAVPTGATSATDAAFREVFESHTDLVWRTLRALGVEEASLDDALQDVFLVVFQKVGEFQGRSQLSTWIYAIAYRTALNYRRKRKRHEYSELPPNTRSVAPDPATLLSQGRAAQFIQKFCMQLAEGHRDVFVLCVLENRSAPEVAGILGVKLNTVYSRTHSTRLRFRAELERLHGEQLKEEP